MEDRTVIEWDKDDLDALGMLKVDVLALGMLTCLRKGFELLEHALRRRARALATIPTTKTRRLRDAVQGRHRRRVPGRKPGADDHAAAPEARDFYDLVIEVAIVRPGPIQGDMVHPYLRRRDGLEKVDLSQRPS